MLFSILSIIGIALIVVVIFNVLIIVHELGHFLAALWRGLVVEKFAIWFGKPIWKKEINGVEYILGSIPAGGYVALPQLAPMESLEGESKFTKEELKQASPLDKIIVAFAGPLFSFGLALVFACIVWMVGKPVADRNVSPLVVGYVSEQVPIFNEEQLEELRTAENPVPMTPNPAYQEGLRSGDIVLAVDGQEVKRRMGMGDSIMWRFIRSEGEKVPVLVERNGQQVELELSPRYQDKEIYERGALRLPPIPSPILPLVGGFLPGSPAEKAGLQPGDLITAINGQPISYNGEVVAFVRQNPTEPATYTVERKVGQGADAKTETLTVTMTPEKPVEFINEFPPPMLGIQFAVEPTYHLEYPNPIEQVKQSVRAVLETLDALLFHSGINASHLSGPAGIMNLYGQLLADDIWFRGWRLVLWISVVINVNLALINLFPLPVLDGGHITFAIYEWIRRKPVNVRVLEVLNGATAVLLIGFMLYVTFFDVQDVPFSRLWSGGEDKPAIVFEAARTESN